MKIKANNNNYIIKNAENKKTILTANQISCKYQNLSKELIEQKAKEARKWCAINQL